jgi:hypothetical protein
MIVKQVHQVIGQLVGGFAECPHDPPYRAGLLAHGVEQLAGVVLGAALKLGIAHDARGHTRVLG